MFAKRVVAFLACGAAALALCVPAAPAGEEETTEKAFPTVTTRKTEKGRESKIRVLVPTPETRIYCDDKLTKATGTDRSFRSPALEEGKRYTYRIVAIWVESGKEVNHETKLVFRAGEDVLIDFRR
jgi:uncharacterized protein (TIGR03000 family)